MEKRFANAGEILAVVDLKVEEVEMPEWNTWVRVRELSGADREWLQAEFAKGGDIGLRSKIAARVLVNEAGVRMYDDGEIDMLGAKSYSALERVSAVALRLSQLAPGAVEAAVKNSEPDPSSGSSTTSP